MFEKDILNVFGTTYLQHLKIFFQDFRTINIDLTTVAENFEVAKSALHGKYSCIWQVGSRGGGSQRLSLVKAVRTRPFFFVTNVTNVPPVRARACNWRVRGYSGRRAGRKQTERVQDAAGTQPGTHEVWHGVFATIRYRSFESPSLALRTLSPERLRTINTDSRAHDRRRCSDRTIVVHTSKYVPAGQAGDGV